jgi:hypothetical protein
MPSPTQEKKWATPPAANRIDVAIDGSGSMLGLTGSPEAIATWKAVLKGMSLAAASTGVPIQAVRSGSGELQPIANVNQAADPCFFSGCGAYRPVSSSLDSLWKSDPPKSSEVPLKVVVSDLEVNDGEISGLIAAIKPHVKQGAVIGVLAVKSPFDGSVYNSQGVVIHTGKSQRPIYILATGPRAQLHTFLNEVKTKAVLGGARSESIKVTLLDEQVSRPTLKASSIQGVPPQAINSGLPIRLGSSTYSPALESDYQFVRMQKGARGVRLSSGSKAGDENGKLPDIGLGEIQQVSVPGVPSGLMSGIAMRGMKLLGQQLVMELAISEDAPSTAFRVNVPRGRLPEDWWISWDRRDPRIPAARDQTDGLLLLLTSLSTLLVEPGSSPAAAFCIALSN